MLLCPAEYEPQSLPPTPHQLALAYLILVAAARHPTRPRRLLAFYNGGEGAGASQRWRHLQFVELKGRAPVEEWTDNVQFQKRGTSRYRLTSYEPADEQTSRSCIPTCRTCTSSTPWAASNRFHTRPPPNSLLYWSTSSLRP